MERSEIVCVLSSREISRFFWNLLEFSHETYRKIPKISPGAYIFQRPFLRGLFLEELILGGAYIGWEFCVTKLIGLASSSKVNFKKICVTVSFLPCFTLYLGAISKYKPPGAYIGRGDLTEGFLRYDFGGGLYLEGPIHGGTYFRNFTVFP